MSEYTEILNFDDKDEAFDYACAVAVQEASQTLERLSEITNDKQVKYFVKHEVMTLVRDLLYDFWEEK